MTVKMLIFNFFNGHIYKTIILPLVLYECETCSVTLREEHGLRVFENRVLRRIFGLNTVEKTITRDLCGLYFHQV
jgi:hypothetical protein